MRMCLNEFTSEQIYLEWAVSPTLINVKTEADTWTLAQPLFKKKTEEGFWDFSEPFLLTFRKQVQALCSAPPCNRLSSVYSSNHYISPERERELWCAPSSVFTFIWSPLYEFEFVLQKGGKWNWWNGRETMRVEPDPGVTERACGCHLHPPDAWGKHLLSLLPNDCQAVREDFIAPFHPRH